MCFQLFCITHTHLAHVAKERFVFIYKKNNTYYFTKQHEPRVHLKKEYN